MDGWGIFSSIATAASAVATFALAILTRDMVREMRDTREEQSRPYVVAYLEINEFHVDFVCKNIGKTMAKNIDLEFDRPLTDTTGKSVKEVLFSSPFPSMPPEYVVKTFLGSTIDLLAKKKAADGEKTDDEMHEYKVCVRYSDLSGKDYNEEYIVSLKAHIGRRFTLGYETKLLEHLDGMKNSLKEIAKK